MPNRILKESICCSEDLDRLKPFEETVFYRLIVNCDDFGRSDARPAYLKSKLFVTKKGVTEQNVEDAILKLASVGLVRLYEVNEKPYLLFPKWELHQQIRAKKSKYPAPDNNGYQMISDDSKCPRNPIQSESNNEHDVSIFFETAWKEYPRKKGKGQVGLAQKKRLYMLGDGLIKAIKRYADEVEAKNIQEQYVMYGSTFFNSGYVDYLDENYANEDQQPDASSPKRNGRIMQE